MPNLIVIMLDSFRQDHVGVYHQGRAPFAGIAPCQTPHIDKFAAQSLIFEHAYPEAFPTIPVRTALMTGQRTLPFRPWQPLEATDVTLRSDSRLLVEQLSGRFRVKHPTLIRLNQEARRVLAEFPHVKLEHVPREQNKHADRLANAGVDEWLAGEGAGWTPEPAPGTLFEPGERT